MTDAELLGALDHAMQVGLIADRPADNGRAAVALDAHALEREREAVAARGSRARTGPAGAHDEKLPARGAACLHVRALLLSSRLGWSASNRMTRLLRRTRRRPRRQSRDARFAQAMQALSRCKFRRLELVPGQASGATVPNALATQAKAAAPSAASTRPPAPALPRAPAAPLRPLRAPITEQTRGATTCGSAGPRRRSGRRAHRSCGPLR